MIKRGSGVIVTEVNSKLVVESISSFLQIQKASLNNLKEAERVFEPTIAQLTSKRMESEDLLNLEQNIR